MSVITLGCTFWLLYLFSKQTIEDQLLFRSYSEANFEL